MTLTRNQSDWSKRRNAIQCENCLCLLVCRIYPEVKNLVLQLPSKTLGQVEGTLFEEVSKLIAKYCRLYVSKKI